MLSQSRGECAKIAGDIFSVRRVSAMPLRVFKSQEISAEAFV